MSISFLYNHHAKDKTRRAWFDLIMNFNHKTWPLVKMQLTGLKASEIFWKHRFITSVTMIGAIEKWCVSFNTSRLCIAQCASMSFILSKEYCLWLFAGQLWSRFQPFEARCYASKRWHLRIVSRNLNTCRNKRWSEINFLSCER